MRMEVKVYTVLFTLHIGKEGAFPSLESVFCGQQRFEGVLAEKIPNSSTRSKKIPTVTFLALELCVIQMFHY
jgi:hypothetical protein